jgi:hypothetical protein
VIAPGGVAATRDGRRIAYIVRAAVNGPPVASLRVYEDGRGSTEQLRVEAPDWLLMSTWTSDARALLVARQFRGRPGASPERREVWRLRPGVPEGEPIGLGSTLLREITLHPAGTAVAYVDGAPSWVLRTLVLPANEHNRP